MHECVDASQGYHGVRGRGRVRVRVWVSWGGWWVLGVLPRPVGWLVVLGGGVSMVICPTGVGILHDRPHDSPATRQHTHACTVTNRVFRGEIQVVG